MPTYEYACKSCGEHLEVVQSFRDEQLTECPACGGDLRKVFGSVGIVLKGSGFYKTDSRAASKAKAKSESGGGSEPKSEAKSEAKKADATSDTKSDSKKAETKSA
jgi:putative FmdB family regulatory protein